MQLSYTDVFGNRRRASRATLTSLLGVLGAPIDRPEDAADAIRAWERDEAARLVEPVSVAWADEPVHIAVRVPAEASDGRARCRLHLHGGTPHPSMGEAEERTWTTSLDQLAAVGREELDGREHVILRLTVPADVPLGYHALDVSCPGRTGQTTVIRAPRRAPDGAGRRDWGVFLPLYALRTQQDWGCGDLTDLEALTTWVTERGGDVVATLPMLAAFLDEPFEPSPYSPVSRLFWNEIYCDPMRTPEFATSEEAKLIASSASFQAEQRELRARDNVDFRSVAALRRRVLEACSDSLFAGRSPRRRELERYEKDHPELAAYVRFRGAVARHRDAWQNWPSPAREGRLGADDVDEREQRYQLYAQWSTEQQLAALAAHTHERGAAMYVDLPLGVNGGGFDVWRHRDEFAIGASGGAPPDTFFRHGQNWGFPPPHPHRGRSRGHAYFAECIRTMLRHASILRIDHVMGLHRLFWIPNGTDPEHGAYVRSHPQEAYAILTLEAHRASALVVGEDLGTVPHQVRSSMQKHGIMRNYVLQYELSPDPYDPPPAASLATLNTHDMAPFAGFWHGEDLDRLRRLDFFDDTEVEEERQTRELIRRRLRSDLAAAGRLPSSDAGDDSNARTVERVLEGSLASLAASEARVVVVNLEDLWLESEPQNVPGTTDEHPNWRRRARRPLEELEDDVTARLAEVDRLRKEGC